MSWGIVLCTVLGLVANSVGVFGGSTCKFSAIFNFGDSNSDTGGLSASFYPTPWPYGETFFGNPAGRASDGRLIVDFIAEGLGLPYLDSYLDSMATSFRNGANFATGGSTIRAQNATFPRGGYSPFSLNIQTVQFARFKSKSIAIHTKGLGRGFRNHFPKAKDISEALYMLDIGQNDLAAGFASMSEEQVKGSIPDIINDFSQAIQFLYGQGAMAFWIHNTGPIGCLPYSVIYNPTKDRDENGCIGSSNVVAQEFNKQLKERVIQLRQQLPLAALTYVDMYSAKYYLISYAHKLGLVDPFTFCCGHSGEDYRVFCGQKMTVNGSIVSGDSCENPSRHVSWDGVHYTEVANQWLATNVLSGLYSDPPVPLSEACYRHAE